ncbi:MAG: rod-binding protein [Sulfuricurvum sp.]|jgi:Rod binding domain-containing protein|nr:rod-binding protein [Sulfuricurvum sp.]
MEISNINYQKQVPTIGTKEGDKVLREKTDQFEAIIVKMMLDEAMKEEKNLFSTNDPGDKIFKSMYREELSNASAGGFGFSQMLFEHLSQKGVKN